jgi:hypothetical protein
MKMTVMKSGVVVFRGRMTRGERGLGMIGVADDRPGGRAGVPVEEGGFVIN